MDKNHQFYGKCFRVYPFQSIQKYKKEWDTHLAIVSPIFFFLGVFLELFLLQIINLLLEIESLFDRFTVGICIIHQEAIIVFHHGHDREFGSEIREATVFCSDSFDIVKIQPDTVVTNRFFFSLSQCIFDETFCESLSGIHLRESLTIFGYILIRMKTDL